MPAESPTVPNLTEELARLAAGELAAARRVLTRRRQSMLPWPSVEVGRRSGPDVLVR